MKAAAARAVFLLGARSSDCKWIRGIDAAGAASFRAARPRREGTATGAEKLKVAATDS